MPADHLENYSRQNLVYIVTYSAVTNCEFTTVNYPDESTNFNVNQTVTFSRLINYPTRFRRYTTSPEGLISEELAKRLWQLA